MQLSSVAQLAEGSREHEARWLFLRLSVVPSVRTLRTFRVAIAGDPGAERRSFSATRRSSRKKKPRRSRAHRHFRPGLSRVIPKVRETRHFVLLYHITVDTCREKLLSAVRGSVLDSNRDTIIRERTYLAAAYRRWGNYDAALSPRSADEGSPDCFAKSITAKALVLREEERACSVYEHSYSP